MPVRPRCCFEACACGPSVQENSDGRSWLPAVHRFSTRTEPAAIPRRTIPNVLARNCIARIQIAHHATPALIW